MSKSNPLHQSFTLLCYAFKTNNTPHTYFSNKDSLWKKSMVTPDESFLFNHIQDFFTKNSTVDEDQIDENQAIIYEIHQNETNKKNYLYKNFFKNRVHTLVANDESAEFSFYTDESILSPKLFFVPLTQVVILTFGITLTSDFQVLDKLRLLNNRLRVLQSGVATIHTKVNEHPEARDQEEQIRGELSQFNSDDLDLGSNHKWKILDLIQYLLSGFPRDKELLSPNRMQGFTYLALKKPLSEAQLDLYHFHLRRFYSSKYQPTAKKIKGEELHLFKDIYFGSSLEGSLILVNASDTQFLEQYHGNVLKRNIWTFILCYHQRLALMVAAAESKAVFAHGTKPNAKDLGKLIERMSRINLNCLFSQISHYSSQNDFYWLCYENFKVQKLYDEVKSEIGEMSTIIKAAWRQRDEKFRKREERHFRDRSKKIETLLTLLIIPQIWLAMLSTNVTDWEAFINQNIAVVGVVNFLIVVSIVFLAIRLYLIKK